MEAEFNESNLRFNVEVADNGFIMTTYVPEGKKELKKAYKSIHMSKTALFEAISVYLGDNS